LQPSRIPLDVHGKRLEVERDPYARVTPQRSETDVLGTLVLSILAQRPGEAMTSRPLLLAAVGQETNYAGQDHGGIASTHAEANCVFRLRGKPAPISRHDGFKMAGQG
jgi:hypothetical protein